MSETLQLDPQIRRLLEEERAAGGPAVAEMPIAEARERLRRSSERLGPANRDLCDAEDIDVGPDGGGLPARLYRPREAGRRPLIVYFHGGGWVRGDIETHDGACRQLCHDSGCAVLSVDYRRAPEHPFPAARDDALSALRWAASTLDDAGIDPGRLVVAGDSAGGNLAALAALHERDRGGITLAAQLLVYPATDLTMGTDSYRRFGSGYRLTHAALLRFAELYLQGRYDAADPQVSPLFAARFDGLPPAIIVAAPFDPLVDEGRLYAARLIEAGVAVDYITAPGMVHGFWTMGGAIDVANDIHRQVGQTLRRRLDLD